MTLARRGGMVLVAAVAALVWNPGRAGAQLTGFRIDFGYVSSPGVRSYYDGCGERLSYVGPGTYAWGIGLQPGDVILSVNGCPLNCRGAWDRALTTASAYGYASLAIRDCHTGRVVYRRLPLDTYRPSRVVYRDPRGPGHYGDPRHGRGHEHEHGHGHR